MKRLIAVALFVCGFGAPRMRRGGYSSDPSPAAQTRDSATVSVDEEADSGVVCIGACTSSWIPLTIDDGTPTASGLPNELGIVLRGDGTRQVTFERKRLYTFVNDAPGQAGGDGLSDAFHGQRLTWHVVSVGGVRESDPKDDGTGDSFGY
jgi:predicted lipoprotein with Yx(FWY)xxD motif